MLPATWREWTLNNQNNLVQITSQHSNALLNDKLTIRVVLVFGLLCVCVCVSMMNFGEGPRCNYLVNSKHTKLLLSVSQGPHLRREQKCSFRSSKLWKLRRWLCHVGKWDALSAWPWLRTSFSSVCWDWSRETRYCSVTSCHNTVHFLYVRRYCRLYWDVINIRLHGMICFRKKCFVLRSSL